MTKWRRYTQLILFATLAAEILARSINAQAGYAGARIPDFVLRDFNGRAASYSASKKELAVVVFVSTRCPMSNAFNSRINTLYNEFGRRLAFFVVNSNANESVEEVRDHAERVGYDFPVYKDADNKVADLLGARSTPESFVIDRNGLVAYRGYIEDSPNPERARTHALLTAIEAVLAGKAVPVTEGRFIGCAIRRVRPQEN